LNRIKLCAIFFFALELAKLLDFFLIGPEYRPVRLAAILDSRLTKSGEHTSRATFYSIVKRGDYLLSGVAVY
jgi:hypothetical protein